MSNGESTPDFITLSRDEILQLIADQVADHLDGVPSLYKLHFKMQRVEDLAGEYRGHDTWDQVYLLEALMQAHEVFRDWIGSYT